MEDKKKTIVLSGILVEAGNTPRDGGSVINVSGIHLDGLKSVVPIVKDFDSNQHIGEAEIYIEGGNIKSKMRLNEEDLEGIKDLYPAIGGIATHRVGNVIEKFKLTLVGLSSSPNDDESIKTIGDQLKTLKLVEPTDVEKQMTFEEVCKPVMEFLAKKHNPHTTIVIDSTKAEILQGVKMFNTDEFVKD